MPVAVDAAQRTAARFGKLLQGEAGEDAHLDQFARRRIDGIETIECSIDIEQFRFRCGNSLGVVQRLPGKIGTTLQRPARTRTIDQDLAHGARRAAEK